MRYRFPYGISLRSTDWIVEAADLVRFLRLFYACAFLRLAYGLAPDFINVNMAHGTYLWPVAWIPLLPSAMAHAAPFFLIFTAGLFLGLATIFPINRTYRILGSLFFMLVLALKFSFGSVQHAVFMWGPCALFVCWCKVENSEFWKKMNAAWIQGACSLLCVYYLLASVYKIETYFQNVAHGQNWLTTLANFIPIQLWYAYYIGGMTRPPIDFLSEPGVIPVLVTVILLLFQLSSILPIFYSQLLRAWSVLYVLFHAVNSFVLETNFHAAALLIIVLMGMHPMKEEHNEKQDQAK